jgi:hypothetical protein
VFPIHLCAHSPVRVVGLPLPFSGPEETTKKGVTDKRENTVPDDLSDTKAATPSSLRTMANDPRDHREEKP